MTRTPFLRSKGQRSSSPGRFTAALTRQAAAAVSVGTYWAGEPTATLQSAGVWARRRKALRRPQREERGRTYCGGRPYSLLDREVCGEFVVQILASINWSDVGDACRTHLLYFVVGGAEPREGGGLARAWTDWRSEGASAPTLRWRAGARGGDDGHGIRLCFVLIACHIVQFVSCQPAKCMSSFGHFWQVNPKQERTTRYNRSIQKTNKH